MTNVITQQVLETQSRPPDPTAPQLMLCLVMNIRAETFTNSYTVMLEC